MTKKLSYTTVGSKESHATKGKVMYQVLLVMNVIPLKNRPSSAKNRHTISLRGMRFFARFARSE